MEYIGQSKKNGKIEKEDFLFGTPFMHPTLIMKKEHILKVGGYPLYNRCEDYAMEMELYSNSYKGYIMDEILMKYRMDSNGYSKKKFKNRITEMQMKKIYFKKLQIPKYKYYYILKPIIVGMIPKAIMKKYYHRSKFNSGEKSKK